MKGRGMQRKGKPPANFADLRRLAESRRNQLKLSEDLPKSDADILRLVHELQVYQIEMEMQNEELLHSRAEVEDSLELYTELYDFSPVGYFTLSANGTIAQVNLHGAQVLQVERAHLVGMHFVKFVRDDSRTLFNNFLETVLNSQAKETCELEILTQGDQPCWIQIEAVTSNQSQVYHLGILNISARKQAEFELLHLSMHDTLTGLYNRGYFYETLKQLEHSRHFPISILMGDVDKLKATNDQYGHAAGDALLIRAAQAFAAVFRAADTVARIGGDEFAAILPGTDARAAAEVLHRFNAILQEQNLAHPELPLQFTFGLSTVDKNASLTETLKEADADLYRKKRARIYPEFKDEPVLPLTSSDLRRHAERLHKRNPARVETACTDADRLRLIHELEVHQIELDLQTEELRHSQNEIQTALERYTDLYDFAPVGYFSLGQDGTILQANLNGSRLLGIERLHLVGGRFGLYIREEDRAGFANFLEKTFSSLTIESCEVALLKEGRQPFWVQIEATVVDDEKRCRAVVIDINERKQAQEKLSHAQNEMEQLLKVSNRARKDLLTIVKEKAHAEQQILQLNSELEERVNTRTAELLNAVAQLKESEATILNLFRISIKLNATLDLEKILDMLAQEAIRAVDGESGFAGLRSADGMTMRKYFQQGEAIPFEHTWPLEIGIPGWVLKNKIPYGTSDAAHDPLIIPELPINKDIRSVICTPILDSAGEVLAFFDIRNKQSSEGFSIQDQDLLMAMEPIASIAIQNAVAYQQRLAAEKELKQSFESIRALAANLETVREEERTQIARDLHDQLGQALTAMKFDLAMMSDQLGQNNPNLLHTSRAITKQMDAMIKTVRRIATELRPGILDDFGLAASIEWQAHDFAKRTGIPCSVYVPAEDLALSRTQSVAMFRILQESLTNIIRHANAKTIAIRLSAEQDVLTLQIHDDGRGIQADEIVGLHSLGLLGMQERAIRLGGTFDIHGLPGDGTLVTVSFPMKRI